MVCNLCVKGTGFKHIWAVLGTTSPSSLYSPYSFFMIERQNGYFRVSMLMRGRYGFVNVKERNDGMDWGTDQITEGCLNSEIFVYSKGIRRFFRMPRFMNKIIIIERCG